MRPRVTSAEAPPCYNQIQVDKGRCEGVQGATAKPPARARRRETPAIKYPERRHLSGILC